MSLHTNYVKLTAGISGELLIPVQLSTMSWHILESTMSWHLSVSRAKIGSLADDRQSCRAYIQNSELVIYP